MKKGSPTADSLEAPLGTSSEVLTKDVGSIVNLKSVDKDREKVSRRGMPSPAQHDATIWLAVYAASIQGQRAFTGKTFMSKSIAAAAEKDASMAITAWNLFLGDHFELAE